MTPTRFAAVVLPLALGAAVLALWEMLVHIYAVPRYVLPAPSLIVTTFVGEFSSLMASTWTTFRITLEAFLLAVVTGIAGAIVLSQSRVAEMALSPYAVALQVSPIFAIAPLIVIWIGYERIELALLLLAWLAAFFPILANVTAGLKSVDHNLLDLFRLHGASRLQTLWRLRLPAALPHLLSAMKISGGLALIGTIVAEFAAGSGTATGLGWRILEAGHRLQIARQFAALFAVIGLGLAIYFALTLLEHLALRRWHDSATRREA